QAGGADAAEDEPCARRGTDAAAAAAAIPSAATRGRRDMGDPWAMAWPGSLWGAGLWRKPGGGAWAQDAGGLSLRSGRGAVGGERRLAPPPPACGRRSPSP